MVELAKGLPKSIIKKYGISKKGWQVFKGKHPYKKVYKGQTSNPKSGKKTMGKKRRYTKKRNTRKRDKRFPISAGVGLATSVFAPAAPGWSTPYQNITDGHFDMAVQGLIRAWTGVAIGGIGGQPETSFNAWDALNPFDMNDAPAWKAMFWTGLFAKIIKKFTKQDPISKIPFVGRYVKFS